MGFKDELAALYAKYGMGLPSGSTWNADPPDSVGACLVQEFIDEAAKDPHWVGPSQIRYINASVLDIPGLSDVVRFAAEANLTNAREHVGSENPVSAKGLYPAFAMTADKTGHRRFVDDESKALPNTLAFMGDNAASGFKGPRAPDFQAFIRQCNADYQTYINAGESEAIAVRWAFPLIDHAGGSGFGPG